MNFLKYWSVLAAFAVLAGGLEPARAAGTPLTCAALSTEHAHTLAEEARQAGDYRQAAECYRLAGEPVEADRVLARAFAESNEANTKKAAATLEGAKSQARRIREAFRGRGARAR